MSSKYVKRLYVSAIYQSKRILIFRLFLQILPPPRSSSPARADTGVCCTDILGWSWWRHPGPGARDSTQDFSSVQCRRCRGKRGAVAVCFENGSDVSPDLNRNKKPVSDIPWGNQTNFQALFINIHNLCIIHFTATTLKLVIRVLLQLHACGFFLWEHEMLANLAWLKKIYWYLTERLRPSASLINLG